MQTYQKYEADAAAALFVANLSAFALNQDVGDVLAATRGTSEAVRARQVAMYLAHVTYGMSLARVARAFDRDRSTVAYACRQVEDARDDVAFDDWLEEMEEISQRAPAIRRSENGLGRETVG